ncbi:hypothetical protein AKJ50_01740 [candidate division MSBL1 archaeon SCGC-AAA382A13]|uniref:ABC transporter domain-containing protein n=1 Tax=candidate division MSBL1 archaeon SCGC-AAA382A13 TaxID=1698279 RepID=A0A133VFC1_9EURY|nr:hypothetical protein AKJ50_01740 [candidate division MSBL1 archaeon SCGC-AAA382A13]
MSIIELKNVDTIYDGEEFPTIRNINLEINQGEFVCVMGPNGAGKTTLLETVNGLLDHTNGRVSVLGENIKNDGTEIRKRVGYLLQNFSFSPDEPFLVEDVVMMGRVGRIGILNSPDEKDWDTVYECMDLVGVSEFAKKPIGKLSGGEQQKVMLARVMAQEPEILLLDEPFTNLDFKAKEELQKLIINIYEKRNLTTLMVTHDVGSVPKVSSRIVLMDGGQIVLEGNPQEVIESKTWKSVYGLTLGG